MICESSANRVHGVSLYILLGGNDVSFIFVEIGEGWN